MPTNATQPRCPSGIAVALVLTVGAVPGFQARASQDDKPNPDPLVTLKQCEDSQRPLFQKCITKSSSLNEFCVAGEPVSYELMNSEVRRDGDRVQILRSRASVAEKSTRELPENGVTRTSSVSHFQGRRDWISVAEHDNPELNSMTHRGDVSPALREVMIGARLSGQLFWLPYPVTEMMCASQDLRVRDGFENIGAAKCVVLDASGEGGDYTAWFDVDRGHQLVQVFVTLDAADRVTHDGRRLDAEPRGGRPSPDFKLTTKMVQSLENVRLQKIGETWVAVAGTNAVETTLDDGSVRRHTATIEQSVDLNPDFTKIPDAFELRIPAQVEVIRSRD